MALEGPQVTEILDHAARTGTMHLGIVPDLGIYQYRPSEALLKWFERKGAKSEATAAATRLSEPDPRRRDGRHVRRLAAHRGQHPLGFPSVPYQRRGSRHLRRRVRRHPGVHK
ncbi:MAG: hypothetical protein R3D80_05790 [Paracoccaceae bacterium]